MSKRIGILTGGGDAPGLNAVIRAVVKDGVGQRHWQVIGIEDSFNGILDSPQRLQDLTPRSCQGLLHRGGTMLGTTNHGDPFDFEMPDGSRQNRSAELARLIREQGLEGLIVVGGDGTQEIGWRMMQEHGIPVVGVPKTIDNDLACTDYTFGFMTAVENATDALDKLHTTAEAHDRVMLLEVMGRTAGWIALYAGIAGGADCIALPEIPYDPNLFCEKIRQRQRRGRQFTLIVVAEGAAPVVGGEPPPRSPSHTKIQAGSAAQHLAAEISERLDVEIRVTVLGHLQRGGSPVAHDRILATWFGAKAVDLVANDRWGELVVLRGTDVTSVPLAEAVGAARGVEPHHPLIDTARAVGISFGDA